VRHRHLARAGLEIDELTLVSTVPVLGALPPLAFFELLAIRGLQRPDMERYRSNMICALRKTR